MRLYRGRVFVFCATSLANRAWHGFHDSRQGDAAQNADPRKSNGGKIRRDVARRVSRHLECAGHIREFDEKL